jgi:hypothetical protein
MINQHNIEMSPLREVDEQIKKEPSRAVKFFLVKYKCILLFTFLGFAVFQMIYILADKIVSDGDFMAQVFQFLNTTRARLQHERESSSSNKEGEVLDILNGRT